MSDIHFNIIIPSPTYLQRYHFARASLTEIL